ncbi:hypothetical protein [Escherichia coli]|uniref:hypothetical protein n=1 Tax=Escherichia coli TaxID=562 RepID=UPI003976B207
MTREDGWQFVAIIKQKREKGIACNSKSALIFRSDGVGVYWQAMRSLVIAAR